MAITLDGTNGITTPEIVSSGGPLVVDSGAPDNSVVVNSAGNLKAVATIAVGNATPSTSGAGITFPATASASSDANTLDDYEEGTWTPVVKLGATTQTTGNKYAYYVKIGRVVYVGCTINNITKSGSGNLTIEGLPFTVGAVNPHGDTSFICRWDDITSDGIIIPYAFSTTFELQNFSNVGYTGVINDTDCSATYQIYGIWGFYFV
jgi:hypothetical protein